MPLKNQFWRQHRFATCVYIAFSTFIFQMTDYLSTPELSFGTRRIIDNYFWVPKTHGTLLPNALLPTQQLFLLIQIWSVITMPFLKQNMIPLPS